METQDIYLECDACGLDVVNVKFDNKAKCYLCKYCSEELNSLPYNRKPKKAKEEDYR